MLMVDVRRTSDDVLVIDHEAVRMLDDREVPIRDRSYADWSRKTADTEAPITKLDEVFAIAKNSSVGLILDLREPGTEALIARAIRQSGLPQNWVTVASPDDTTRTIMRGLDPRIPLAHTLRAEDVGKIDAKLLGGLDVQAVTWYHKLITPAVVNVLRARNIQVFGWTVDLAEDMRRLRDTCRVDGIITNFPDILRGLNRHS